ncbi:hypothetical protein Tco_1445994, partial [Tanacetum coccineum]
YKLELEKNKAKATLLKAQPSFPNVEQLKELLVKSLKIKFSNILSAHDFGNSLPTELKDLPFKLNELTGEVKGLKKQVHELEIELPGELKEIPTKLDDFTKNVASVQAKLKTLDALPSLLLNITQALNKFAQVLNYASSKVRGQSVPSAGQANTMPAEGEKNTNQATISQLFQRRAKKNAEKENMNNQQPKLTTPPATTIIPPKDKGKKTMSSKDAEEVSTECKSDDETTHVPSSMVESSKKKDLKNAQKKIKEEVKAEAAKHEGEIRKKELIDLLGPEVVNKENDTSEIIPEFKASDLHLAELGIDLNRPLSEQDPLDRLNDLANKKRKHADDIHDFFRANKRLKSSIKYEDHPVGTVLNKHVLVYDCSNYGVTCEDGAKRCNSRAKTKRFEENYYLLLYVVSSKEDMAYQRQLITRMRIKDQFPIWRITHHLYAVCTAGHQSEICN